MKHNGRFNLVPATTLFSMLMVLILTPLVILVLTIFILLRQVINVILKIKYGRKFGGLLKYLDRNFIFERMSKSPVDIIYIIAYDKDDPVAFYKFVSKAITEVCFEKLNHCPKLFAVVKKFCGYSFLLKGEVGVTDCIKKLKKVKTSSGKITQSDLINLLNSYGKLSTVNGQYVLWEVLIGTQPVKWEENKQNEVCYPVLFRWNHLLGDGHSILKMIFEKFSDEGNACCKTKYSEIKGETNENVGFSTFKNLGNIFKQLVVIWFCMAKYLESAFWVDEGRSNSLYGPQLTGKRSVFSATERYPHYLNIIKRIKRSNPGSTFMDIILTAVGASLSEYYEKYSSEVPKYVTISTPAIPASAGTLTNILDEALYCHNFVTFPTLRLPILVKSKSLTERLHLMTTENFCRTSRIVDANYLVLKAYFNFMPEQMIEFALNVSHITAIVSNLPGPRSTVYLKGFPLKDVIPVGNHRERTALILVMYTYCGRLRLVLSFDRAINFEENAASAILDNFYKYLDLLDSETNEMNKK